MPEITGTEAKAKSLNKRNFIIIKGLIYQEEKNNCKFVYNSQPQNVKQMDRRKQKWVSP